MWDDQYAVDEYLYGKQPNDFLLEMTDSLQEGNVLCLADGEGRNSVHLARQGFAVTAVDASQVGLSKAKKLADESGVAVDFVLADLADYTIEKNAWNNVVSIFCHLLPDVRRRLHADVVTGLKPGGTFLLEAYTPKQLGRGTGGPPSAEMMMDLESLTAELDGLQFVFARELDRAVVEGIKHTGEGSVVQLLARKTTSS